MSASAVHGSPMLSPGGRPPNLVDSDQTDLVHGLGAVEGMSMQIFRRVLARFMLDSVDSHAQFIETGGCRALIDALAES